MGERVTPPKAPGAAPYFPRVAPAADRHVTAEEAREAVVRQQAKVNEDDLRSEMEERIQFVVGQQVKDAVNQRLPVSHPFETGQPKEKTSWVPDPKVAYGGIGGAVTVLLVSILKGQGIELDPVTAGAVGTLVTFLVQYLIPSQAS